VFLSHAWGVHQMITVKLEEEERPKKELCSFNKLDISNSQMAKSLKVLV